MRSPYTGTTLTLTLGNDLADELPAGDAILACLGDIVAGRRVIEASSSLVMWDCGDGSRYCVSLPNWQKESENSPYRKAEIERCRKNLRLALIRLRSLIQILDLPRDETSFGEERGAYVNPSYVDSTQSQWNLRRHCTGDVRALMLISLMHGVHSGFIATDAANSRYTGTLTARMVAHFNRGDIIHYSS